MTADPAEDLDEILDQVAQHLLGEDEAQKTEAARMVWRRGLLVDFEALAIPTEQRRLDGEDCEFDLPSVCQTLQLWDLIAGRYGYPHVRYWHSWHEPEGSRASFGAVTGWRLAPEGLYLSGVTALRFIRPGWSVSVGTIVNVNDGVGHAQSFLELSMVDATIRGRLLDTQITSVRPSELKPDEVVWIGEAALSEVA